MKKFINVFYLMTGPHLALHSFPTRRSSDLLAENQDRRRELGYLLDEIDDVARCLARADDEFALGLKIAKDRKSTRLNSSHRCISYAVFCLKKKKPYTCKATAKVDELVIRHV